MAGSLRVEVDGVPLPEEQARALWTRFSAHMETHRGDLRGFAANEGYASVTPGVDAKGPILRASRTQAQAPYGDASRSKRTGRT
jgi:hypothetical protein